MIRSARQSRQTGEESATVPETAARIAHSKQQSNGGNGSADLPDAHALAMLLRKAYFALRRCSNAHCAPFEANGDQFVLLKLLADREGVTQQDLVRRGGYDANTTGNMLRLMAQQELIVREPHPHDGRAKLVRLTGKGRRRLRQLWQATGTLRQRLWKCVRPQDRKIIGDTLLRIAEAMQQARADHGESEKS